MHSQHQTPDVQGSGSGRSPVGTVFHCSLLPSTPQNAAGSLSPPEILPWFSSTCLAWCPYLSAFVCTIIYAPLTFIAGILLKDLIEDQLISWTWHLTYSVVVQWNQLETLPCLWYAHYPQLTAGLEIPPWHSFLDPARHFHRHPLWLSLRFRNLPASCSHPYLQECSLALRGVQKYSIRFSHEARSSQK